MKNLELTIQDIDVKIFKMPVEPALELWDQCSSIVAKSFQGQANSSEIGMVSGVLESLSSGALITISKKMLPYIHVSEKTVKSLDELDVRLSDDVDTLSFLDDILIDFLKFQFSKKFENLKKKLGLQGDLDLSAMLNMNSTGESGE